MSFLYFFDLLDFDTEGNVCATKTADLSHARSNFLYLTSKYNQNLLQEEGLAIPEFFKEDLSKVLENVENNGDFLQAKNEVLSNCLPKIQKDSRGCSDRELMEKLGEYVSIKDKEFARKVKGITKKLEMEYIITKTSGNIFENILNQVSTDFVSDKKSKSNLFKDIIKYNSLVNTADKVKANSIELQDIQKMVS